MHATASENNDKASRPSGWLEVGQNCFGRIENNTGWLDHCYKMYRWSAIVSGNYIYTLNHYATFASKGIYHMTRGTIKAVPTATFTWADWDPAADSTRSCSPLTLSVTYAGVGLNVAANQCETWDITKYTQAGRFDNNWRGGVRASERNVEYLLEVRRPSTGASWDLPASFFAEWW